MESRKVETGPESHLLVTLMLLTCLADSSPQKTRDSKNEFLLFFFINKDIISKEIVVKKEHLSLVLGPKKALTGVMHWAKWRLTF